MDDANIAETIKLLQNVKNGLVQSCILQYQRGRDLSTKQKVWLLELAEQHKKSLARGFTGIDHGITDEEWYQIQIKNGLIPPNSITASKPEENGKVAESVVAQNPNRKLVERTRFRKAYKLQDIKPLLESINCEIKRVDIQEDSERGWRKSYQYRVYDPSNPDDETELTFKRLTDFVEWATGNDPEHPLALGVKERFWVDADEGEDKPKRSYKKRSPKSNTETPPVYPDSQGDKIKYQDLAIGDHFMFPKPCNYTLVGNLEVKFLDEIICKKLSGRIFEPLDISAKITDYYQGNYEIYPSSYVIQLDQNEPEVTEEE